MKKIKLFVLMNAFKGKNVSLDAIQGFTGMTLNSVYWYISRYKLGRTINGTLHVA